MERGKRAHKRHSRTVENEKKSDVIGATTAPQRNKRVEVTNIKYNITCNGNKTMAYKRHTRLF